MTRAEIIRLTRTMADEIESASGELEKCFDDIDREMEQPSIDLDVFEESAAAAKAEAEEVLKAANAVLAAIEEYNK